MPNTNKDIQSILSYQNPSDVFADGFYAWSGGIDQAVWTPLRVFQVFTKPENLVTATFIFGALFSIPGLGVLIGASVLVLGLIASAIYLAISRQSKANALKYADMGHILHHLSDEHTLKKSYNDLLQELVKMTGRPDAHFRGMSLVELMSQLPKNEDLKTKKDAFVNTMKAFVNILNNQKKFEENTVNIVLNLENYRIELSGEISAPAEVAGKKVKTKSETLEAFKNTRGMKLFFHIWDVLSLNSMAYWMVWMVPFFLMGVSVIAGSSLVVPAILLAIAGAVSLVYAGLKLRHHFKKDKPTDAEIEKANEYQNNLKHEIEKFCVNQNIVAQGLAAPEAGAANEAYNDDVESEIKKVQLSKHIPQGKQSILKSIIKIGGVFITGYMIGSFLIWPLLDIADLIVTHSVVGLAAGFTIYSLPGVIIGVLLFSLVCAAIYAVNAGLKHGDDKKNRQETLDSDKYANFIQKEKEYAAILKLLNEKGGVQVKTDIEKISKVDDLHGHLDDHIKDMHGKNKFDPRSTLKKFGHRLKEMVNGTGSGIYIVRSICLPGTVLFLLTTNVPGWVILTIALTVGLAVGIWQAAAYHNNKKEKREKEFLDSVDAKTEIVEKKISLLKQVAKTHQVQSLLFKAASNKSEVNNTVAVTVTKSNSQSQLFKDPAKNDAVGTPTNKGATPVDNNSAETSKQVA